MKSSLPVVTLIATMLLSSVGCVAERKYREMEQAHRDSQEQVVDLDRRIAELNQQIEQLRSGPREDAERVAELRAERDELMRRLDELGGRYEDLAAREFATVLPDEVDEALREFADRHSDMVEYDAERGMVKFRSDLTFDLGSADVTSSAKTTLGRLSDLLNQGVARDYEVRVIGHTDSVRIARAETRAKHPTNWHLSAHRAISVRDALEDGGIAPVRTSVAGYGPYRPLVQNAPTGAEPNRRVEIFLVPMTPVNEQYLSGSGQRRSSAPAETTADEDTDDIPLK